MTTDRVLAFAKEKFEDHIENLLDDPSHISAEGSKYVAEMRLLAADLGMDLEALVAKGSPFEIKRFRDLEAGKFDRSE